VSTMMQCGHRAQAVSGNTPVCTICFPSADSITPIAAPNLEGRFAKCSCDKTVPSTIDLPFFEFRGEGSKDARESCKKCGYFEIAHVAPLPRHLAQNVCAKFQPRGASEYDLFYCGCRGWD
jgi:hypothetical protein